MSNFNINTVPILYVKTFSMFINFHFKFIFKIYLYTIKKIVFNVYVLIKFYGIGFHIVFFFVDGFHTVFIRLFRVCDIYHRK